MRSFHSHAGCNASLFTARRAERLRAGDGYLGDASVGWLLPAAWRNLFISISRARRYATENCARLRSFTSHMPPAGAPLPRCLRLLLLRNCAAAQNAEPLASGRGRDAVPRWRIQTARHRDWAATWLFYDCLRLLVGVRHGGRWPHQSGVAKKRVKNCCLIVSAACCRVAPAPTLGAAVLVMTPFRVHRRTVKTLPAMTNWAECNAFMCIPSLYGVKRKAVLICGRKGYVSMPANGILQTLPMELPLTSMLPYPRHFCAFSPLFCYTFPFSVKICLFYEVSA